MNMPLGQRTLPFACGCAIALTTALSVSAQSGSRTDTSPPQRAKDPGASSTEPGSSHREGETTVGLQGYCPVCLIEMRKWIKGDPRRAIDFDGKRYLFPGAEQAEMFKEAPLKYVPVLGGDDVVHYARTGKRIEGQLSHGVIHAGRSYFFASAENKQLFQSNPDSYANADLALGGECIVCRVDMNQRVSGRREFTVIHKGVRYQFPGEEQQAAFLKSPNRYVETLSAPLGPTPAGGGSRQTTEPRKPSSGSGTR